MKDRYVEIIDSLIQRLYRYVESSEDINKHQLHVIDRLVRLLKVLHEMRHGQRDDCGYFTCVEFSSEESD